MDKMLYVSMTGAHQNSLAQRAHANNLANITTNGFRRDFEQARSMPIFGDSYPSRVYAMSERPGTDFTPGSLQETGRDLDVAVGGKGWLAVQAPDGSEAYVRTASLNVDALGVLRTGNGLPVMGNAGPIAVPPEQKIEIGKDGTISIRALGEAPNVLAEVDRLKLVNPDLKQMEKGGRGLMLIDLEAKDTLAGAAAYTRSIKIEGIGRGGKERDETLEIRSLNNARALRGRKGKAADLGFKPTRVTRVE